MKLFAALFMVLAVSTVPSLVQADPLDDHDAAGSLREFIIDYLRRHGDPSFPADRTIKVVIAPTALGPRDPQGYVIYIRSGNWCGSGGCHTLIVTKVDGRFQPLGLIGGTELPILSEKPRGYNDLELVATVRIYPGAGKNETGGSAQATVTRRGDTYDFYSPNRPVGADGPLEPLISAATPEVPLY